MRSATDGSNRKRFVSSGNPNSSSDLTGTTMLLQEGWYLRVQAFFANWCCREHPNYVRSIVGYRLEKMLDQEQSDERTDGSSSRSSLEVRG